MRTLTLFCLALILCPWAASGLADTQSLRFRPFGLGDPSPSFLNVTRYTLQAGDTATSVARNAGLTVETVLSFNRIASPRFLRSGQTLRLPDRDGVLVSLEAPTSVLALADNYRVFPALILLANQLPQDTRQVRGSVFVPGAQVDPTELRQQLGQYFAWPTVGGRISSFFGRRNDPFTGERTSHSGVDIANRWGAPVLAAGAGVVTSTGYNSILGNHIVIDQGRGYTSVYGHLSSIATKVGRKVKAGQLIGRVGSTGYSTGPHLHFSAYYRHRLINPMRLFG